MIQAIVTDIEGTTSSLSFVKDVLFPYAAERLPDYVRRHRQEPSVQELLAQVAVDSGIAATDTEALIRCLLQWIQEDKKATPLKTLQGMIWQQGYEQGDYQAHVYEDAVNCLKKWHRAGLSLYVYSSGSIKAQQLFFTHSEAGDLSKLFTAYFDTTTGPKQEVQSYRKIADTVGKPPEQILFLSDIAGELDAAREAGFDTCWLIRSADSFLNPDEVVSPHQVVTSFDQICF
jgi:enolase-phosphatase E1